MFFDKLLKRSENTETERADNLDPPLRSFAKAISWRITGSLDTIMLAWFFTQQITVAISIGLTEVVTKVVLYYFHERAWSRTSFGRPKPLPCAVSV